MTSNIVSVFPEFSKLGRLTSVGDWIRFCASQMERASCFYGHGFSQPWQEARFLILRGLQLDWHVPDEVSHAVVTELECEQLYALIRMRCVEKKPTAYLLQEAWFCNEPFKVNESVLIPRSPIGEMIEAGFEPWLTQPPENLLDLCTGSGCIGIAMARAFPQAHVDISDLSEEALSIAVENIDAKDLEFQVDAYLGDLFESLPGTKYDLIVSNPPYVDLEDISDMPEEFAHEPRIGLVAGDDGLDIVRKILADAPKFLTNDGWLVCEVGNSAVSLMDAYPQVEFQWPEFAHGGHGVFVISAIELKKHNQVFLGE